MIRNSVAVLALALLAAFLPLPAPAQATAPLTVQSISPDSIPAGQLTLGHPLTVVVTGTGFTRRTTATVSAPTISARPLPIEVDASGTHAKVTIHVPLLERPAKLTIVLANPPPAGSTYFVFTVTAVVAKVTPSPVPTVAPTPTVAPAAVRTATPVPTPPPLSPPFVLGLSTPGPVTNIPRGLGVGQAPVPVVVSMSPTRAAAGGSALTLTLSGNNFTSSSTVAFGSYAASPTSRTSTSLTVVVPAGVLAPGTVPVSVTNPAPGGGTSGALAFTVTAPSNPVPAISGVTPTSVVAGIGATTVTVTGTGFGPSTTGTLGSTRGVVSGSTITFSLPASATSNAGTLSGLISNPAPGGGSAAFTLNTLNGLPSISGFTIAGSNNGGGAISVAVGSGVLSMSVTGSGFLSGSVVTIGGTPVPTTFVSAASLTALISPPMLQRAGTVQVGVTNPPPGGGSANAGNVLIVTNMAPILTDASPTAFVRSLVAIPVNISGAGFSPTTVALAGGTTPLATVFNSPTSLTVTIPPALQVAGPLSLRAITPAPGGGTSSAVTILISNPAPVLQTVSPVALSASSANATLTVTGNNFVSGAIVSLGGTNLATTFVSATQLTAVLPAPYPIGRSNIIVTNPAPSSGASNALTITVASPQPTS